MYKVLFFMFFFGMSLIGCRGNNGSPQTIASDTLQIVGPNGRLHVLLDTPVNVGKNKLSVVILMHGLMSSSEEPLIRQMAEKLNQAGFATVRFDFNGHGRSEGEFIEMTIPKEIGDAKAVYHYLAGLNRFSSINISGHSQGGVVASLLAGELGSKIRSMVLLAPAGVIEDEAKNGTTLFTNYDPKNVPEYITAFNHKIRRECILTAQKLQIYERAAHYKGPVCIIHSKADELVPYSYGEKYHSIYSGSKFHLLENPDHAFSQALDQVTDLAVSFFKENVLHNNMKEVTGNRKI